MSDEEPQDPTPEESKPEESTPQDPTPEESKPEESTPQDPTPEESKPEQPQAEEPQSEQPQAAEPSSEEAPPEQPQADAPASEQSQAERSQADAGGRARDGARRGRQSGGAGSKESSPGEREEAIPGAHLEPDLVLEEQGAEDPYSEYASGRYEDAEAEAAPEPASEAPAEQPRAATPLDLAADARYPATGKRKTAVARVILRPGDGAYTVNGRPLDEFFPRPALQRRAREALEAAGYESSMDVRARIHGGGVSSQAGALRHGVARALVEADPGLRGELKRRGLLTRDARAKERKKAGLKKARKRPQFSKR